MPSFIRIENYKHLTPLGRFADDEDINGPVVFLASEASAYITRHNLLMMMKFIPKYKNIQ